jgi:hypothetical protein
MISIFNTSSRKDTIYNLIAVSIWIILFTFLMRYLWNQSLVKYISILEAGRLAVAHLCTCLCSGNVQVLITTFTKLTEPFGCSTTR